MSICSAEILRFIGKEISIITGIGGKCDRIKLEVQPPVTYQGVNFPHMTQIDILSLNNRYTNSGPKGILLWAWDTFGLDAAVTSSFQSQSVPLLHMISRFTPELPILFLDTGFHFPDTLRFRDDIVKTLNLKLRIIKPEYERIGFQRRYGELYRKDPDLCCFINKVKPLQNGLKDFRAWITGIRGDQTSKRKNTPLVRLTKEKLYKISPLARWTKREIWQYIEDHRLPVHPLYSKGYVSIGCAPCTRPVTVGEEERAGRWPGFSKNECGIHLPFENDKFS